MMQPGVRPSLASPRPGMFPVVVLIAVLAGCASPLPEYAGRMETVELDAANEARGASVQVEGRGHSGVVGAVSRGTQIAAASQIQKKFRKNFSPREIRELTANSMAEALERDAPFRAADGNGDGWMRVTIERYGIDQEGAQPTFFVTYGTKIVYYEPDGGKKRVWKDVYYCQPSGVWEFGPNIVANIGFLGAVNKLSDREFRAMVEEGFKTCSGRLAQRIEAAAQP